MGKRKSTDITDSHERFMAADPLELTEDQSGENPNAAVVIIC